MDVFPAAFPLKGLCVAVAGEGDAAEAKARLFAGSPAQLRRVPPAVATLVASYAGARLAFVALGGVLAAEAATAARAAGAVVNVVDRPELCDFTTPAIVDRGSVVGAVMTGGAAPLLAAELRRELEALWPQGLGAVAALMHTLQPELRAAFPAVADRRAWLRRLLDGEAPTLALRGDAAAALALARAGLAREGLANGGGGGRTSLLVPPGSPDLLSLRALQALSRADRLVVADGVDAALLAMARRDAPVVAAGEATSDELGGWMAKGDSVLCVGPETAFTGWPGLERLPVAAAV